MQPAYQNPILRGAAVAVALSIAAFTAYCNPHRPENVAVALPKLNLRIDNTSVSGISSGAYMAGQFEMTHAKLVKGAAIIAGGPYGCSESVFAGTMPGTGTAFLNLGKAINGCMLDLLGIWGVANPETLAGKAAERAATGDIDPIADIIRHRVYLFSGQSDHTVVPSIVKAAAAFYAKLGVADSNIKLVTDVAAGHAFVTDDAGGACERSGEPYIVDCDYDQAGALLGHIYGPLAARAATPSGDYVTFDQRPFENAGRDNGLAGEGVIYIPPACRADAVCSVHIAFHGCAQNRETVGDTFIKESGFARWADTNKLVVLFPQVATTALNPQACWDWWGYTGPDYLTRNAPQITAVLGMLKAFSGNAPQS